MKRKTNLVSSILIALIAGFIYFQLGGAEDIKRIASFGFQILSSPIEKVTSSEIAAYGKLNELINTKKNEESELSTLPESLGNFDRSKKDLAWINPDGIYMSIYTEDLDDVSKSYFINSPFTLEGEVIFNRELLDIRDAFVCDKNIQKIHVPDYWDQIEVIASLDNKYEKSTPIHIYDDDDPITIIIDDSNGIKISIEKLGLDGFDLQLNAAMEKLNIVLKKLGDNLKDMNFDFSDEENKLEFEEKMKEFEEDMKEFEEDMKEWEYDFEENMKEHEEDMKEFKEDIKEHKKDIKGYKNDCDKEMKEENK